MDVAPSCELGIPGVIPGGGPGWYLVGANGRVEVGPFPCIITSMAGSAYLHQHGRGVNPAPWMPRFTRQGLLVGSRLRSADERTGPLPG